MMQQEKDEQRQQVLPREEKLMPVERRIIPQWLVVQENGREGEDDCPPDQNDCIFDFLVLHRSISVDNEVQEF